MRWWLLGRFCLKRMFDCVLWVLLWVFLWVWSWLLTGWGGYFGWLRLVRWVGGYEKCTQCYWIDRGVSSLLASHSLSYRSQITPRNEICGGFSVTGYRSHTLLYWDHREWVSRNSSGQEKSEEKDHQKWNQRLFPAWFCLLPYSRGSIPYRCNRESHPGSTADTSVAMAL